MKIVVTGGAGFVGSHIAERALEMGHQVTVIDDLSSGVNYTPKKATFVRATIGQDNATVYDAIQGTDAIIHAAAYADLRRNWDADEGEMNRQKLFERNVCATFNLLEQMPAVPIVFVSTASIYGPRNKSYVDEKDFALEQIESPYAASKLACEGYVAAYGHARSTPWYVLRLVNVVGARTSHGVIGDFVRMAKTEGQIHAKDDGKQRKSWVHVKDVADRALNLITRDPPWASGVYNATSDERISWQDIITEMRFPASKVTHELVDRGAIGDPWDLHVKSCKWDPCKRPVRDGIRDALSHLGWPQ